MSAEQGSAEWFAERCGCVTASKIADVMAKGKGSAESAARYNYRAQLVAERLTGVPGESFTNGAMQRGTDLEPIARAAYEIRREVFVDQVGFIKHPTIAFSGASPDGHIGDDGLVEIKCPNTATHIEYLQSRTPPLKYVYQMQWQMECTGRQWCDWVSFDDRLPESLQVLIVRIGRDETMLSTIRREVETFLAEVASTVEQLQQLAKDMNYGK